jgi:cell fate regulator YaaT (PSP1 superfamily)
MAKEQGLSLNPTKISGTCGRLMCCLKYEQNAYEHLIKLTPRVGSVVKTASGTAVVTDVNLISGMLHVRYGDDPASPTVAIHRDEVKFLRGPKSKGGDKPEKEEEIIEE